jgi:hypothetical protein
MAEPALIESLRRRRARLLKAYILHVGLFASSCAFAAADTAHGAVATSLWLALLTIPPVLYYTVLVHRSCRAVDPRARTAGLLQVIVCTVLFTPYESSLMLPLKNLWISRRVLRTWAPDASGRRGEDGHPDTARNPKSGDDSSSPQQRFQCSIDVARCRTGYTDRRRRQIIVAPGP